MNNLGIPNTLYPALIGFTGVIVGALIASLTSYALKKREAKFRIIEKIFDKRILAHENILKIPQTLISSVPSNKTDIEGNALTYPTVLQSPDSINNFKAILYNSMTANAHWLNIELYRELNYIQDYFQNLTNILQDIPPEKYPEIALLIKSDTTNLAQNINNKTRIFFEKETVSMTTKIPGGRHKLPKEDTIKRLQATLLFKNHAKIREYIDL